MDVGALRGRIIATLEADADSRRRAELDLKTVSVQTRPTDCLTNRGRPRNTQDSPMRCLTSCRQNRRIKSVCQVSALGPPGGKYPAIPELTFVQLWST